MKGNKIYSVGFNKYTKEIMYGNEYVKVTIHAEIDALFNYYPKNAKGMDMLIIRIGRSLDLRNSRPCNSCIDKMNQKGIRKVYYSNDNGDIVYEFIDSMPRIHISSGNMIRDKLRIKCQVCF
jgi:deoxycytidylate deaminase